MDEPFSTNKQLSFSCWFVESGGSGERVGWEDGGAFCDNGLFKTLGPVSFFVEVEPDEDWDDLKGEGDSGGLAVNWCWSELNEGGLSDDKDWLRADDAGLDNDEDAFEEGLAGLGNDEDELLEDDGAGPFGDRNGLDEEDAGLGNDDNCDLLGDDEHV